MNNNLHRFKNALSVALALRLKLVSRRSYHQRQLNRWPIQKTRLKKVVKRQTWLKVGDGEDTRGDRKTGCRRR